MPIYEYTCSACGHRTDILHGINDPAPAFCPECGAEGTLRKGFAPPAILFKGSGWAKKDRAATRTSGSSKSSSDGAESKGDAGGETTASSEKKDPTSSTSSTSSSSKPAAD
jgi:putative FmdB family regulatory protein